MNILFVSDFIFNPIIGGTERVTDILSRELVNVGYKVFYLCGPVSNSSYLDYDFPAEVHLLPEPGGYDNNVNCCFLKEIVSPDSFTTMVFCGLVSSKMVTIAFVNGLYNFLIVISFAGVG